MQVQASYAIATGQAGQDRDQLIVFSCSKNAEEAQVPNGPRTTTCTNERLADYPYDRGEPALCESDTCSTYYAIWEASIQENNGLSQAFFERHIRPHRSRVHHWAKGCSYNICYYVEVDWAVTYVCDQFIINIDLDNANYPLLDLPRGVNLTKEEIMTVIENRAFSSRINKINAATELSSSSTEEALNDLIAFADTDPLCFLRIALDKNTGNLTLKAYAEYEHEENACVAGDIDLITGEKVVVEMPCGI